MKTICIINSICDEEDASKKNREIKGTTMREKIWYY